MWITHWFMHATRNGMARTRGATSACQLIKAPTIHLTTVMVGANTNSIRFQRGIFIRLTNTLLRMALNGAHLVVAIPPILKPRLLKWKTLGESFSEAKNQKQNVISK